MIGLLALGTACGTDGGGGGGGGGGGARGTDPLFPPIGFGLPLGLGGGFFFLTTLRFNLASWASSCFLNISLSAGGGKVCSILSTAEFLSLFSVPNPTIILLNKVKAKSISFSKSFF